MNDNRFYAHLGSQKNTFIDLPLGVNPDESVSRQALKRWYSGSYGPWTSRSSSDDPWVLKFIK